MEIGKGKGEALRAKGRLESEERLSREEMSKLQGEEWKRREQRKDDRNKRG